MRPKALLGATAVMLVVATGAISAVVGVGLGADDPVVEASARSGGAQSGNPAPRSDRGPEQATGGVADPQVEPPAEPDPTQVHEPDPDPVPDPDGDPGPDID